MAEQWLSIAEYARTYNVSDMTIRRRIKTGKLKAILQEGKYFIPVPMGEKKVARDLVVSHPNPQMPPSPSAEPEVIRNAFKTNHHDDMELVKKQTMHEDFVIPSSIRQSIRNFEVSLVDSKALLEVCEGALKKVQEAERRTVEKFKYKLESLEAALNAKNIELKTLKQQMEDLQILINLLEKKRNP